MPIALTYGVGLLIAYLLGSIPTGLLIVRAMTGKDVRSVGSGRTGATNAMRAAGLGAGVLTGLGDIAKGMVAVYVARLLAPGDPWLEALCAAAVVAGHNWPVFIGFRGGVGAGTNTGSAIGLWPLAGMVMIPLLLVVVALTGYASVGSTLMALAGVVIFTLRAAVGGQPWAYAAYSLVAALMVWGALLPNYRRLVQGTERVVGPRAQAALRRGEGLEQADG
jgi:glycerol-3-phosphate acyltransferase PlsY